MSKCLQPFMVLETTEEKGDENVIRTIAESDFQYQFVFNVNGSAHVHFQKISIFEKLNTPNVIMDQICLGSYYHDCS